MTAPIPSCEPTSAAAGDTWQWRRALADYPVSAGWQRSYAIVGPAGQLAWKAEWFDAATETVTIPAAATGELRAGTYQLTGYVTRDGDRRTVYRGTLLVTPDYAKAAPGDTTTFAQRMLKALEAELQARVTGNGSASEAVAAFGKQISRVPIETLEKLRARYAERVERERRPGAPFRRIEMHFRGRGSRGFR